MDAAATRPLLILDLDETLIYGSETRLDRDADFLVGPFHVYKRPGLDAFLSTVNHFYDLAIWSSASGDYVQGIASTLRQNVTEWIFVWSRSRCVQRMHPETFETIPIKDLKKVARIGYPLERILIVDDTHEKVCRNYGNAIYVSEFLGSNADDELPQLARFLVHLHSDLNFRRVEKRGWRSKVLPDCDEEPR
jgi:RNA polymerase II subunit A small phosphatase-like protein